MTTICGGNTSSPKSGLAEFVTVTSGALALTLQRYGAARLQFLIPLLGLPPLELGPFCSTDPPAMPTFTEDEVFSLLRVGLDADYVSGLAKARDMIANMLWYDLCECDAGSLTPITEPTLPTNTPDPVLPTSDPAAACYSASAHTLPLTNSYQLAIATFRLPIGASQYSLTLDIHHTSGTAVTSAGCQMRFFDINGSNAGQHNPAIQPGINDPDTFIVNVPANSFTLQVVYAGTNAGATTDTLDVDLSIYCGGNIGTPTPCCPPDPATQSYLDLILQMVTLIQRQSAPFSYASGATHSSLSGHGSFAVSSLLGVAIDVTTLPDSYGRAEGSPEALFDIGYVTLGTADGYEASHRIGSDGSLFIPPLAGLYTSVGYTLSPGVEVAITELVREP